MSNTNLRIADYKNSYASLNGSYNLKITRFDIARGFISIGKKHWSQKYLDKVSLFDLLSFWSAIRFRIDEKPFLVINKRFEELDASKKNDKSYSIGMGITSIIAERVLKIPCMQDVDMLHASGALQITAGTKERGDLVGLDTKGKWHVLESKGRTYPHSVPDRKKAKRQAERITSINGRVPETKGYCMTHINKSRCDILLSDPDEQPLQSLNLVIDTNKFIQTYYTRFFGTYLSQAPDITVVLAGLNFVAFRIDIKDEGSYIAIEQRIFENLKNENYLEILSLQYEIFDTVVDTDVYDGSLGTDGILFFEGEPLEFPPNDKLTGVDRPVILDPEVQYEAPEIVTVNYVPEKLQALSQ